MVALWLEPCGEMILSVLPSLQLIKFVNEERLKSTVYPPARDVFSWTLACAIKEVSGDQAFCIG